MKIIVRMMGGLGNQIFIYAYIRNILKECPDAKIYLDTRGYSAKTIRQFELLDFILNDNIKILTKGSINKIVLFWYDITRCVYRILRKILKNKVDKIFVPLSKIGFYYNYQTYCPIYNIGKKKYIFVYGYFQDYRYVESVKKELREEFVPKEMSDKLQYYLANISNNNCGVSIRWGKDYKDLGWPICSEDYFIKCMELIEKREQYLFFVFSDEVEYAKKSLISEKFKKIIFVENLSPAEQMYLMMKCDDYVISNSSFAWIGACLGKKDTKAIYCPKLWFRDKETQDTNLFTREMIVVD